jgi:hypothetical protein
MIRNAFVFVFERNSSNVIFSPFQVTTFGDSVLATLQAIVGSGLDATQCPGNKSGVFDAGASPSFIAAIGSGYLMAFGSQKSAR